MLIIFDCVFRGCRSVHAFPSLYVDGQSLYFLIFILSVVPLYCSLVYSLSDLRVKGLGYFHFSSQIFRAGNGLSANYHDSFLFVSSCQIYGVFFLVRRGEKKEITYYSQSLCVSQDDIYFYFRVSST